jgi:hypothetical protein
MVNMDQETQSGVVRTEPIPDEGHAQSVTKWKQRILAAKKYFEDDFKRMREDMVVARQGASKEWLDEGNYTVPIIKLRHMIKMKNMSSKH